MNTTPSYTRRSAPTLFAIVAAATLAGIVWAATAYSARPAALGLCVLTYALGLRHALDADHVAAIDNVTRKLVGEGQRPVAIGLFFALGHSLVVFLVALCIALAASGGALVGVMRGALGTASAIVSILFLLLIAGTNAVGFRKMLRHYRASAGPGPDHDPTALPGGLLSRLIRPVVRSISRSWQMILLGFLFGLSFDTASEVAMFSLAATEAANEVAVWKVLVFPFLFGCGMALVDLADGILMIGVYGWAAGDTARKLRYNIVITGLSILLATTVASINLLEQIRLHTGRSGEMWVQVAASAGNLGTIGVFATLALGGLFACSWLTGRTPASARIFARCVEQRLRKHL